MRPKTFSQESKDVKISVSILLTIVSTTSGLRDIIKEESFIEKFVFFLNA